MWRGARGVVLGAAILVLATSSLSVAASSPVGEWVRKSGGDGSPMKLTIERWGGQAKFVWHLPHAKMILSLVSNLDGKDAPLLIDGKPSGETMAIKLVDAHHSSAVVKMGGKAYGTSKATFSDDFGTMTVDNDYESSVGGNPLGKSTEVWVRK
jgi:hypothetical protein